ncbi:MAG TPA: DNA polymerase IV [bacterium]|nr:DNA polymerase IV [bacterium]
MTRKILHVDMDAFFVSVELLKHPELRGKPVIIGGAGPRGVVSTCSYEARKYGIHSAMPSVQAKRLCPEAIWLSGDHEAYRFYSKKVFEILRRFSPEVYPLSIDEGRVDLTGSEALFGPAVRIADTILRTIRDELGLPASGGLANSGITAKIAAEFAKPGGLTVVLPGSEQAFLAPLPIERIPGVGQKSLPRFHQLNIFSIGDLTTCDPDLLRKHFGIWSNSLLKIASGVEKRATPRVPDSPSRSHECTFQRDISDPVRIRLEIRKLVEKLGYRLRRSGLKASAVTVKIRDGRFRTVTRTRRLDDPTNRDHVLFKAAESMIMSNLPSSGGIRLLGVVAQNLVNGCCQHSLFDSGNSQADRFYSTVDTIKNKFGSKAVSFGEPPVRIRVAS